jgi:hypothetical protein
MNRFQLFIKFLGFVWRNSDKLEMLLDFSLKRIPDIVVALRTGADGLEKVGGYIGFAENQIDAALGELGENLRGVSVSVPRLETKGMYDGVRDLLNAFHIPIPYTPDDSTRGALNEIKLLTKWDPKPVSPFDPLANAIASGNATRSDAYLQLSPETRLCEVVLTLRSIADGLDSQ